MTKEELEKAKATLEWAKKLPKQEYTGKLLNGKDAEEFKNARCDLNPEVLETYKLRHPQKDSSFRKSELSCKR